MANRDQSPDSKQNAPDAASDKLQTVSGQPVDPGNGIRAANPAPSQGPRAEQYQSRPAMVLVHSLDIGDQQRLDEETMDPNRHYRWTNVAKVNQRKLQGYEIELHREGGPKPLAQGEDAGDGTIRSGDLILMSCPKEIHQNRQAKVHKLNEQKMQSATATTEAMAKAKGISLLKDASVPQEG